MRASARTGDKIGLFRHVHCAGVAGPGEALLILDKAEIRGDDDRTLAEVKHGMVSLGLFLGKFLFELNFEKEKCIGISNF